MAGAPELRPVSSDSLHVTLCFLGWRRLGEAPPIAAAMDSAVGSLASFAPARLSLGSALWLPPRRPRVLAVQLADHAGTLGRVQATLSETLADGGWYRPERRPFLAHVTVGRVRARERGADARDARGTRGPRGTQGRRPPALTDPPALDFLGSRVTLYRSRLTAGGARYEALHTVEPAA